jgi:hypothetical protein
MPSRRVVIAAGSVGVLISTFVILALGEFSLRLIHLMRDGVPLWEAPSGGVGALTLDSRLGWRATAHYTRDLSDTTQHGLVYSVHRSQGQYGFRSFGDVGTKRGKLLVMGDSYTQATAVSDDKTYHALLGQMLGMEVFAYGAGGYGTLQEYLILDEVVDYIRPSMLLWQFCSNDFINNDHALEVASTLNNNGWVRPYWEEGVIVPRSPKPISGQLREWIQHHSRFLYFVISRTDRVWARTATDTVERAIEREGAKHPGFAQAMRVTDELIGRLRARVGAMPIYAFNCDADEPYTTAWENIAKRHGIIFWRDVAASIDQAAQAGEDVLAASDTHWNERGHAIIGRSLAQHFQATRYLAAR